MSSANIHFIWPHLVPTLQATCLPNEEFCLLWLVGPEVNELQHSHGIESEPPQLTCGHNREYSLPACS